MAAPTTDNNTMDIDDGGNIVPAAQINIPQQRDTRSPAYQVLETAELVNNIVQYLPITSYPACSLINRVFREDIFFTSLTYKDSLHSTQHWIESKPRHIFILSAYILQHSADVDAGLPGGALSNQFVFSCQTRSDSVDSYESNGSNSDQRSGESSGLTGTSGESSGGVPHLQRHHTHQPGHDIEPFHSFHTYQPSATVPNIYFKTSSQFAPHLSSPPSLSPHPIAQQTNYTLPHQHHQTATEFLPGQHVSTMNARATIAELSSSDLHHYEADIRTDSNRSSMMVVDVADMSLSPSQILLPPHKLSTFPTPGTSSSSTSWQQQHHQQQYQQQQPMARVVPCPYELATEGSMQYEENPVRVKKGSRTSTGSTHSHDSTISTSSGCGSNGESHHGMSDPSSSSASVLQGGAYSPYASPIMEESSNPSVFGSPYAVVGARGGGSVGSTSGARVGSAGRGGGGQSQGSNSPGSARRSGKELAPEYQRESALQEHNQQLQQLQRQGGRRDEISSRGDVPMTLIGDRGDVRMDNSSSHNHSHHHKHRHQERQRLSRQYQQQQPPPNNSRPSQNWSMAVQTFYYQNSALNAMIVACREHMLSPEGQGGSIILKTDTSRVIWNATTRQEHIWTITPTLMDRTNPDFVEEDFDPDRDA